jgi:hypothetical protein
MLHGAGSAHAQQQQHLQLKNKNKNRQRSRSGSAVAPEDEESFGLLPGGPRGGGRETWRLFFVSVVCVPPPRFRPAAVVGGTVAENPQNAQLAKVRLVR